MTAKLQKRSESPQRDLEWISDLWPKTSLPLFNSIRNENRNRNHHKLGFFNKLLTLGIVIRAATGRERTTTR